MQHLGFQRASSRACSIAAVVVALAGGASMAENGCAFELSETQPAGAGGSAAQGGSDTASGGDASGAGPVTASSGGTGPAGGGAGGGGTGGTAPMQSGCRDGQREGFKDEGAHPGIAACAGGFEVAGTQTAAITECTQAGDDSNNPDGLGCSAGNLCASGWHVCYSSGDVDTDSGGFGCPDDVPPDAFWITGQTQNSDGTECIASGNNNVIGCGDLGDDVSSGYNCDPLERRLRADDCAAPSDIPPWSCDDGVAESAAIVKPGVSGGGVLCCMD